MRKTKLKPEYFTDPSGRRLVRLPVSKCLAPAITEAALFDGARNREGGFGGLYLTGDGSGKRSYVLAYRNADRAHKTLARLLINCPKGYHVAYRDKNSLNLLPENLRLRATWADESMAGEVLALLLTEARAVEVKAHA